MRMIFINLPVKNVEASRDFFLALGFKLNKQFSGETSASIVIEENIVAMLLSEQHFKDFTIRPISDATKATEVLIALSCSSRQEVDDMLAKAMVAGGKPWLPNQDHGFMYSGSFQDPDGHVWELIWMDPSAVQPD
jgi:predicted lactoylglutathione lyase